MGRTSWALWALVIPACVIVRGMSPTSRGLLEAEDDASWDDKELGSGDDAFDDDDIDEEEVEDDDELASKLQDENGIEQDNQGAARAGLAENNGMQKFERRVDAMHGSPKMQFMLARKCLFALCDTPLEACRQQTVCSDQLMNCIGDCVTAKVMDCIGNCMSGEDLFGPVVECYDAKCRELVRRKITGPRPSVQPNATSKEELSAAASTPA